jgi:hypothetical protein
MGPSDLGTSLGLGLYSSIKSGKDGTALFENIIRMGLGHPEGKVWDCSFEDTVVSGKAR